MHTMIHGKKRKLIWKRDTPDHRDLFRKVVSPQLKLPPSINLQEWCPIVEDQGDIGSCTANSSTSAMEYLYKLIGKEAPELSRLFVYWMTRVYFERVRPDDDSGAQIRNVMKALAKYGTCLETIWPYEPKKFSSEPNASAKKNAKTHQILSFYRTPTLRAIQQCLAEKYPVVGGFSCPESIESTQTAKTGIVKYPKANEAIIGGHAVLFVGYDDSTRMLMFQNSWGEGWGKKGFGFLPYQYVETGLADDFWTIRTEEM